MEKGTGIIFAVAFAFLFLMSFTSAASFNATVSPSSITVQGTTGSFNVNIISDANGTVNVNVPAINPYGNTLITFSYPSTVTFANVTNVSSTKQITVNYNLSSSSSLAFLKSYQTSVNLSGSGNLSGISKSYPVTFNSNYCGTTSNPGGLYIDSPNFNVENGYGSSNGDWYLLDNLSANFDVENTGSYDMRNVEVDWALYAGNSKIDSGNLNNFNLNAGDQKSVTVDFSLDNNFNSIDSAGDVVLYVRAKGQIRDSSAGTLNNNWSCISNDNPSDNLVSDYTNSVDTSSDFVVPSSLTLNGNLLSPGQMLNQSVSCGSTVNVAGTAYNIGSNDQPSGSYVVVYNQELGVNKIITLNALNGFESQDFSTSFTVPANATEKTYGLQVSIYDNNNQLYENSNNNQATSTVLLKVSGNCMITPPTVTADISSGEATAGKQVTIHAYIRNEDLSTETFLLAASGYSSWANLVNVSAQTFTLGSGYSKDVYMTFDIKPNVQGSQNFNLVLTSNGRVVTNKAVNLNVAPGSFWANLNENVNWEIVGIVVLNLILLIAIIIVAVKILKRR